MMFRVLVIGDIVGSPGRATVQEVVPRLIKERQIDFVVANGENLVSGSGLSPKAVEKLWSVGVDVVTSGDHIWKRMDVVEILKPGGRLVRPANYPASCPGSGLTVVPARVGQKVAVINLQGRLFMDPIDCPFQAAERAVEEARRETPVILVDFHAEATSEKIAMGWYLTGRVSAVWGTHTHVQTADEQVLPGGTAHITDLGMTGAHRSILGRKIEPVLFRFTRQLPARFDVAEEDLRLCGAIITLDSETGRASRIERVQAHGPS